ncbi:D-Ala-D-Ala carboxypeptidase family metallohydrolase [Rubritalea tangerina]|uniref:D-Ala-D-Ala carboxypeptidase family metallohydrolase n=1 Tax=Rubritalea tangerina TaxID=430798 RepID=A0ABW4Z802_9BACT
MKSLIIVLIGLVTSSHIALAEKTNTNPIDNLPKEWVNSKGQYVIKYANYIESLGLKNITPYMVLQPHFKVRNEVSNSLPPKHLWKNIAETLKVIDKLSDTLGAEVEPFELAYKSPAYNRAVKGRSRSQHLTNHAVRVTFVDVPPSKVAATARDLRSTGFFKGGVGNYRTYTHIDTRGHNVDW